MIHEVLRSILDTTKTQNLNGLRNDDTQKMKIRLKRVSIQQNQLLIKIEVLIEVSKDSDIVINNAS